MIFDPSSYIFFALGQGAPSNWRTSTEFLFLHEMQLCRETREAPLLSQRFAYCPKWSTGGINRESHFDSVFCCRVLVQNFSLLFLLYPFFHLIIHVDALTITCCECCPTSVTLITLVPMTIYIVVSHSRHQNYE